MLHIEVITDTLTNPAGKTALRVAIAQELPKRVYHEGFANSFAACQNPGVERRANLVRSTSAHTYTHTHTHTHTVVEVMKTIPPALHLDPTTKCT